MKQVSAKTRARNETYRILRECWLPGRRCQIQRAQCRGYATEVHHRRGKGADPTGVNDVLNWVAACRPCHDWAEHNRAEARALGYIDYAYGPDRPPTWDLYGSGCRRCGETIRWCRWSHSKDSVIVDANILGQMTHTADGTLIAAGDLDLGDPDVHGGNARIMLIELAPAGTGGFVNHRDTCRGSVFD